MIERSNAEQGYPKDTNIKKLRPLSPGLYTNIMAKLVKKPLSQEAKKLDDSNDISMNNTSYNLVKHKSNGKLRYSLITSTTSPELVKDKDFATNLKRRSAPHQRLDITGQSFNVLLPDKASNVGYSPLSQCICEDIETEDNTKNRKFAETRHIHNANGPLNYNSRIESQHGRPINFNEVTRVMVPLKRCNDDPSYSSNNVRSATNLTVKKNKKASCGSMSPDKTTSPPQNIEELVFLANNQLKNSDIPLKTAHDLDKDGRDNPRELYKILNFNENHDHGPEGYNLFYRPKQTSAEFSQQAEKEQLASLAFYERFDRESTTPGTDHDTVEKDVQVSDAAYSPQSLLPPSEQRFHESTGGNRMKDPTKSSQWLLTSRSYRKNNKGTDSNATLLRMFRLLLGLLLLIFLLMFGFVIYFSAMQFQSFRKIMSSGGSSTPSLDYLQKLKENFPQYSIVFNPSVFGYPNATWPILSQPPMKDGLIFPQGSIIVPLTTTNAGDGDLSTPGNFLGDNKDFPFIEHELENMPEEDLASTFAILNISTNHLASLNGSSLGSQLGINSTISSSANQTTSSGSTKESSSPAVKEANKLENIQSLLRKTLKSKAHPSCSQMLVIPCLVYPYNGTVLPNMFGHRTQTDIWNQLKLYSPVFSLGCHPLSFLFFCTALAPRCGANGQAIQPCRSLCEEVSQHCSFFYNVFYLPNLPVNCSVLKESPDSSICVGYEEVKNYKKRKCDGFVCDTNRCINRTWVCDGVRDCQDMSDEKNCTVTSTILNTDPQIKLSEDNVHKPPLTSVLAPDNNSNNRSTNITKFDLIFGEQASNADGFPSTVKESTTVTLYERFTKDENSYSVNLLCSVRSHENSNRSQFETRCEEMGYSTASYFGPSWRYYLEAPDSTSQKYLFPRLSLPIPQDVKALEILNIVKNNHSLCPSNDFEQMFVCSQPVCGNRLYNAAKGKKVPRIIGGKVAGLGNWPWLVSVYGGQREVYFCVGSIVHRRWVLTAAHCIGNQTRASDFLVKMGDDRRTAYSDYRQTYRVATLVQHPKFVRSVNEHDIALLKLEKDITFNSRIQPVCLPEYNFYPKIGTVCHVTGWGRTKSKDTLFYSNQINDVEVPILSNYVCNEWLKDSGAAVKEGMLCAGYEEGKRDACQGDSGGPLLCKIDNSNNWTIIGIVSWGILCAEPKLPGVYTRVPSYINWIIDTINKGF